MDILKLFVDYGVIGILIIMSFISVWIFIERYLFYKKIDLTKFKSKSQLETTLSSKLFILSSIGANAPYIGLLGTVLGIMFTFYSIGETGFVDIKTIMVGLALALKATAIGLLVAIPSIFFYNFLLRKIKEILIQWEQNNGR